MTAISGTRRKAGELADGTLRVVVDIDDQHKATFHKEFAMIDMPVALAPLAYDFEQAPQLSQVSQPKKKGGPLSELAGRWCKSEHFQKWVNAQTEQEAADYVRATCGVDSRADIDEDVEATALFNEHIREPYMAALQEEDD